MKNSGKKFTLVISAILLLCCTQSTAPGGCGDWWRFYEGDGGCTQSTAPEGCGGEAVPPPGVSEPAPADCTLQVTLNKADAGYSHDLYLDGPKPDLLIAKTTANVGAIARRYYDGQSPLRFFIKVYPCTYCTPYKVYSDSSWARTTQTTGTSSLIAFEDIPSYGSDKDYNDVVIAVEKVNCEAGGEPGEVGETPPPSEPPPPEDPGEQPGGGIVVPPGGAVKVHANFLQATWNVGDLYLAGDPPELLIAKGSNKKGASARNFFYAGEVLVFFLRANGTDFYSNNPDVARVDYITDYNYRIYFDVNWDGDFNDAIVHIVLTPPDE